MDPRLVKQLLVIAVWVAVWFLIVPPARRKKVSSWKWYFGALGAFYGPFLAITFGPIFVSLIVDKPEDRALFRAVMDNLAILAGFGLLAGAGCLFLVRRKLQRLPNPLPPDATFRT